MKKLISLVLAICIAFSLCIPAFAAQNTAQADTLHALGLFQGTDKGYELDKPLTREQGVVMILRLLGQEKTALAKKRAHPFSDFRQFPWADPYVGYAYRYDITRGVSAVSFGYGEPMTDAMFLTMLLRVLGYRDRDDGSADFTWKDPYALAKEVGLSDGQQREPFLRDDMVLACRNALQAKRKSTVGVLAGDLIRSGVFTEEAFREAVGAYHGPVPEITAVGPSGEIDTVSPKLRDYLARAKEAYGKGDYSQTVKLTDEEFEDVEPVQFQWKCTDLNAVRNVLALTIQLSAKEDFSEYQTVLCKAFDAKSEVQSEPVYNLLTGATYYWRLAATFPDGTVRTSNSMSFSTKPGPRILRIEEVPNSRDLGGWPTTDGKRTPEGRVYRTAGLEYAKEDGIRTIMEELGVRTEIDLRNPESSSQPPATSLNKKTVQYLNYSGFSYKKFMDYPVNAAPVLRAFSKPEAYPIVFHCHVGKDRTGAIGFILNALAGVAEPDLLTDYELSPSRYVIQNGSYDFPTFLELFHNLTGGTTQEKAKTYLQNAGLNAMEIHNVEMLIKNDAAVFTEPGKLPEAQNGVVKYTVDPRASGAIRSVKQGSADLPYSFANGELSVTVKTGNAAEVTFADGTKMPIEWK